jgi:hypothetical protein
MYTAPVPDPYETSFPATENPISQGGIWSNGAVVASSSWNNVRTTPGKCFGAATTSGFGDCISYLQGRFSTTKHYVEVDIFIQGGYSPGVSHEVGIYLFGNMTTNFANGYEFNFGLGAGLQVVRQNGANGDFDTGVVTLLTGSPPTLVNGNTVRVKASIVGGNPTFDVLVGGSSVATYNDTTAGKIVSGSPGIGFFGRPGATMDNYCITRWKGGSW